jgi:hypothetical protein
MIRTKYRMLYKNGYIETLDGAEAIAHGNYEIINEQIEEDEPEGTN